jgi:hypothetical protein
MSCSMKGSRAEMSLMASAAWRRRDFLRAAESKALAISSRQWMGTTGFAPSIIRR